MAAVTGCLRGLRVIDLGQLVAAPLSASLFADHGADVIKIERPGTGDTLRGLAPFKDGVPLWWKVDARNKRSIALDFSTPDGRELLLQLIEHADVVVENFPPDVLERAGLAYEDLKKRNPSVIMLSISGFGHTGPYRSKRAYGRTAEAFSGMATLIGYEDGPPMHAGFPVADCITGLVGAFAVLAAVIERERNPGREGQHIDLALYETPFRIMEHVPIAYDQLGLVTKRQGTTVTYVAPSGTWKSADGKWISFTGSTQLMVEKLFRAMGEPELFEDPRFATPTARIEHREELDSIIEAWMGGLPAAEVVATLERNGVAISQYLDIADIMANEHYLARGSIITVDDEELGPVRMPGVVPVFSRTPGCVVRTGPRIDEDRDDVLRDWLGAGTG